MRPLPQFLDPYIRLTPDSVHSTAYPCRLQLQCDLLISRRILNLRFGIFARKSFQTIDSAAGMQLKQMLDFIIHRIILREVAPFDERTIEFCSVFSQLTYAANPIING